MGAFSHMIAEKYRTFDNSLLVRDISARLLAPSELFAAATSHRGSTRPRRAAGVHTSIAARHSGHIEPPARHAREGRRRERKTRATGRIARCWHQARTIAWPLSIGSLRTPLARRRDKGDRLRAYSREAAPRSSRTRPVRMHGTRTPRCGGLACFQAHSILISIPTAS